MADLTGVTRGYDLSHHNDVDAGRLQGDFVIARTAQARGGQYGDTLDRLYKRHRDSARRAGKLFSAYFYVGSGRSAEGNVALHESVEPDRSIPIMLDWENGSGNAALLESVYGAFRNAGYFVWGLYAPRWYWQAQGGPDLSWGPPLVTSRYVDNAPGTYESEYRSTPESYWLPYGNNVIRMLQFTSVGRDPAYPGINLDMDAFKGTRAQLAAWWNPSQPNPAPKPGEVTGGVEIVERITVTPPNGSENNVHLNNLPGSPGTAVIVRPKAGATMWVGHIYAWGSDNVGIGHDPKSVPGYDPKLKPGAARRFDLPGALWCDLNYSARPEDEFVIEVVG